MAAYVGHYIDKAAVERRLSRAVVLRCFDDDNTGVALASEADPLGQLIKDAEAMFEGYCRGIYDLTALRLAKPNEAVRLVLDCVMFLAAERFPRAVNRNWVELEMSVRNALKLVRNGTTRFDVVGSPEPAANQGGAVFAETGGHQLNDTDTGHVNDWSVF